MSKEFVLSEKEYEIMTLLWKENRPLSKAEIVQLSISKKWKESSIYILLNSLMKKGAIKEAGFMKSNTNYGRTFEPTLSENEYVVMQINSTKEKRGLDLPELVLGLINDETDYSVIEELDKIIKAKMQKMH